MIKHFKTLFLCLITCGLLACSEDEPISNGSTDNSQQNNNEEVVDENDNQLSVGGDLKYEVCNPNKYQGNMTLIANVRKGNNKITHYQIAVFDTNGECRGCCWSDPSYNGIAYMTIQGEGEGEPLTIKVIYQRNESVREIVSETPITYNNDEILGTLEVPFIVSINDPNE